MFQGQNEKLMGEIEVKDGQKLRAATHEFRGRKYLNIRLWMQKDDGSWGATHKGFCVDAELAEELSAILQKIGGG